MKLPYTTFLGTTNKQFHLDSCSVSIVNYRSPVSEEWHCHENIHLSLILQGGNLESRKRKDTQVLAGKIVAYDQGELHRNRFTAFPSKNLNIEFKQEFFIKNDIQFQNLFVAKHKNTDIYFDFIKIYNELQINDIYSLNTIQFSLQSMFSTTKISTHKPIWLQQLRDIIEDRWDEFIALEELAHILKVHPVTISKYFKKHHQGTLSDYMRKVKVKRALHFLLHSTLSITEIAHTCGFSDHSHMIRLFKLYLGNSPKNIRKL